MCSVNRKRKVKVVVDNSNRQMLFDQLVGEFADSAFGHRAAAVHDHEAVGVFAGEG